MNETCLVCGQGPLPKTCIKDLFSGTCILVSRNKLLETLQEILETTLDQNIVHSKMLCRKCYKMCVDFDAYKSKITSIKHEMGKEYSTTLQKLPAFEVPITDGAVATIATPLVKGNKPKSPVVVPASKLQPVPADFRLNFSSLAGFGQPHNVSKSGPTPLINLKVTIGSSVFTQSLKTSTVKIGKPMEYIDTTNVITSVKEDIDWNINMVPNDIFSMTNNDESQNGDDNEDGGDENEMEIDEDCTLNVVPVTSESQPFELVDIKTETPNLTNETQYINVNVLPTVDEDGNSSIMTADGNCVKLKLYNGEDDDDEQDTIVVDGENASIFEMMTGQKLIYENGELSLVMEEDDGNDNEGNDDDEQDSNDESQIELQVSGDEETANAIIAAAQEQGGAFIKVEGGEMYRVKSVESKAPERDSFDISAFVTKEGNNFRCILCQKLEQDEPVHQAALDATAMVKHLKTEHDVKLYICQLCGVGMRRRQDYTKHIDHSKKLAAHKGNNKMRLHECDVCQKTYNSRTLLQEHTNTHTGARPYLCHLCDKSFASKYTHQAHLKTHQVRPRPYKCEQCSKSFLSQQNLAQHEKTHLGVKNFVCHICNKAFGTQHNLEVHGVVHSGARPHGCDHCGKAFARRAELVDHHRTHTGERPFECEVCGVRFAQRSNLHSHKRATHLNDKRHKCPECPKRFKRRRLLEYHIKATHTGERPLVCEVCNSTFVYPEHYKKHIRIHSGEKPYYCEICGKSFSSRDNRNTHHFIHSDKKPYECLTCGKSYMRKRLLIEHMNASGHLAESIVVNQPRVTRVHNTEDGVTTIVQLNDQSEEPTYGDKNGVAILRTTGKLELLSDELKSITRKKISTDSKLFKTEDPETLETVSSVEAIDTTQLETQTPQLATDESGAVLRLIQVKLSDGHEGWVALND